VWRERAQLQPTPVLDAMFARDEPLTGPSGTLAWAVDIDNPATGEVFTLTLKEVTLPGPDGASVTRPCAVGFSGNYPRAFDGLARLLSLDMRVVDPAWIGMKLPKLLNYAEPLGHFMAFVPGLPHGERRQQTWPSTVAYMARLIIHRDAMLGVLTKRATRCARWACLKPRPKAKRAPRWPAAPAPSAATRLSARRTAATSARPAGMRGSAGEMAGACCAGSQAGALDRCSSACAICRRTICSSAGVGASGAGRRASVTTLRTIWTGVMSSPQGKPHHPRSSENAVSPSARFVAHELQQTAGLLDQEVKATADQTR